MSTSRRSVSKIVCFSHLSLSLGSGLERTLTKHFKRVLLRLTRRATANRKLITASILPSSKDIDDGKLTAGSLTANRSVLNTLRGAGFFLASGIRGREGSKDGSRIIQHRRTYTKTDSCSSFRVGGSHLSDLDWKTVSFGEDRRCRLVNADKGDDGTSGTLNSLVVRRRFTWRRGWDGGRPWCGSWSWGTRRSVGRLGWCITTT